MKGCEGVFGTLRGRLRGARGIEFLLVAVAVAVLGMSVLNGSPAVREDARTDIERRLERVLGEIEGAGKVRVMVTEREGKQKDSLSDQNDAGEEICGVLVVAEGAGDLRVRMEISKAVHALLHVDLSAIEIAGMQGD